MYIGFRHMRRGAPAIFLAGAIAALVACDRSNGETTAPPAAPPAADTWLRGSVDERFAQVSKHLRGLDVAMVETGYRYGELYWAGRDGNWDYALYQLGKIETAVATGIERRPKRAASARMREEPMRAMEAALESRDAAAFEPAFATLTATCNACHAAEQVAFIHISAPTTRGSPVAAAAAPGGTP
jgi:hypothetical protein